MADIEGEMNRLSYWFRTRILRQKPYLPWRIASTSVMISKDEVDRPAAMREFLDHMAQKQANQYTALAADLERLMSPLTVMERLRYSLRRFWRAFLGKPAPTASKSLVDYAS